MIKWPMESNGDIYWRPRIQIFVIWSTAVMQFADLRVVVKGIPLFENKAIYKLGYIG